MDTDNQAPIEFVSQDGSVNLQVTVQDETIWLSLNQIASLFLRDKSVIAKHIKKIFESEEL
ncbi:MAG: virulence factor, partial [Alphaproteobacteria bacterium]|nr:virulence factor [Alphaproteobacteria bacterium]